MKFSESLCWGCGSPITWSGWSSSVVGKWWEKHGKLITFAVFLIGSPIFHRIITYQFDDSTILMEFQVSFPHWFLTHWISLNLPRDVTKYHRNTIEGSCETTRDFGISPESSKIIPVGKIWKKTMVIIKASWPPSEEAQEVCEGSAEKITNIMKYAIIYIYNNII